MKKLFAVVMVTILLLSGAGSVYALDSTNISDNIQINLNGVRLSTEMLPIWDNSRILVPAKSVFSQMGASVDYDPKNGLIEINKGNIYLTMLLGDRNLKINDIYKKMDASPKYYNSVLFVPLRYVAEAINASVVWNDFTRSVDVNDKGKTSIISKGNEVKKYTVVIDPGHGGYEPGAIYGNVSEKDLNLNIAKLLNKLLKDEGINTVMTREKDTYVGLYERSEIANKAKADLLISIHNNADVYKSTKGSMSLYYPLGGNSKGNLTAKAFADIVQKKLTGNLKTGDLGIIPRPKLAVLRTAYMPAVIAEVGYMSNTNELNKLVDKTFQQNAAKALKEAILEALNKI